MKDKQIKYGILIFSIAMIAFLILNYINVVSMQVDIIQTTAYNEEADNASSEISAVSSETLLESSVPELDESSYDGMEGDEADVLDTASKNTSPPKDDNAYFDLNTVTTAELCLINGIGEVTAQKIIDKRNELGKFTSLEQLKSINGIGDKRFATLQEHLYISE